MSLFSCVIGACSVHALFLFIFLDGFLGYAALSGQADSNFLSL
jgi:hypothetical protein